MFKKVVAMELCGESKCTGCLACYNACKYQAICLFENDKGFIYPEINEKKCYKCGMCMSVCPISSQVKAHEHLKVYATLAKSDEERAKSTSGGVFALLAKRVFKEGGYVYGAVLDKDLVVRHIEAHSFEDLNRIRGSKYVQSDIGLIYRQIKKRLTNQKMVIFSGTPCQVAGLRSFLGRDYPNLLLIDILCHGVPSPGLFRKYTCYEESKAGSKMIGIQFRSKIIGWKKSITSRTFANGERINSGDSFVPGFLLNLYLRESCYSCIYASEKRNGDITLGDYWGYQESAPEFIEDDDKGISLVIVNTQKGEAAFKSIRKDIVYANRSMDDAKRGNPVLYKPSDKPENYSDFWIDAKTMDWEKLKDKYIEEQDANEWMNKYLRAYYDIPFVRRHRKHKIRCKISGLLKKI